ncbi:hypothetical protein [Winogradskyella alexanderae]|uniref:DUF2273 domain-containing protein n=1 Tax=Winogradskyella alexanderae TaxID=2877123 RepID=A0ABS7XRT0_9FLAO|nr:hypothetical protein [Winogradskyella alexanderae]MCA0132114.1 hypothetical protein [Winogradskyella alexanderae]
MAGHKYTGKATLVIGILGTLAVIILIFQNSLVIGIFGTIASLGVTIKGYQDYKTSKQK